MPDVAVVGISNWALDTAKMNRAIHLSRPDPTPEDLLTTGNAILKTFARSIGEYNMKLLAQHYSDYYQGQLHPNFHGLRDYYSLLKYIGRHHQSSDGALADITPVLVRGLLRNFGGLGEEETQRMIVEQFHARAPRGILPISLVEDNLADETARHLLIATEGDAALEAVFGALAKEGRPVSAIHGSKFPDDESVEYAYQVRVESFLVQFDCRPLEIARPLKVALKSGLYVLYLRQSLCV